MHGSWKSHRSWIGVGLAGVVACGVVGLVSGCKSSNKDGAGENWLGEPEADPSYSTGNLGTGKTVYPFGQDRGTHESEREWDRKYKSTKSTYEAPSGYK
ncbi:MAG: hypothetical protein U0572_00410 [Phycisphaerales bacterium]